MLAVVLLGGCGGGGGSGGQRLTRDQYASQADAVCTKYKAKTNALSRPRSLSDLAKVADQVLPLLDDARGELGRLEPPQDEEAAAQAWLDQFDVLVDDVKTIRDKARSGDTEGVQAVAVPALQHNQHANALAAQLGMRVCSKD